MSRPAGEVTLYALALGVIAALVYGSHVAHGGLYWDDWRNAATARYSPDGFAGPFDLRLVAYRPLLGLTLPLPHVVFGPAPTPHLGVALALAVAVSACLYAALRELGLARPHAAAIGVLALVFPWSDSTRLWATGGINNLAVALLLGGLLARLAGLRASGRRRGALRVAAPTLYALSVLTYEATAVAALLSLPLYALRAGWRPALRWWRVDALAVVLATALVGAATTRELLSPRDQLAHAVEVGRDAAALVAGAIAPLPAMPPTWGALVVPLLVAAALLAAARGHPRAEALRRWAAVAAGALTLVAAAYVMFVPGEAAYTPLGPGTANRVNVLAGLGLVTLAYALALIAATLLPVPRRVGPLVAAVLVGAVGLGYVARVDADVARWDAAARTQERVLTAIEAAGPRLPPGTTLYVSGYDMFAAPGIPSFAVSWDLNGAAKLTLDDPAARAFPLAPSVRLECGHEGVQPRGRVYTPAEGADYGRAFTLDVAAGALEPIDGPAACGSDRAPGGAHAQRRSRSTSRSGENEVTSRTGPGRAAVTRVHSPAGSTQAPPARQYGVQRTRTSAAPGLPNSSSTSSERSSTRPTEASPSGLTIGAGLLTSNTRQSADSQRGSR